MILNSVSGFSGDDHLKNIVERAKQVKVQQLISISSVEAFNVRVLGGLARLDEG